MEEMMKKLNECKEAFKNQPENLRFTGEQIAYVFERFIQYIEGKRGEKGNDIRYRKN